MPNVSEIPLAEWFAPAVIAACITATVALLGTTLNLWIAVRNNSKRQKFDEKLANQKFDFDTRLAEKKLNFDKELTLWKRQTELAEEVLALFYEAEIILEYARFPGSLGDEGSTRPRSDRETEGDTQLLDSYYVPIERLERKGELFAQIHAKRYQFMALFGKEAIQPFEDLLKVRSEIISAVRMIIRTYRQDSRTDNSERWEAIIGWGPDETDPIKPKIQAIIKQVETLCRPVINGSPKIG